MFVKPRCGLAAALAGIAVVASSALAETQAAETGTAVVVTQPVAPAATRPQNHQFRSTMDKLFGPGGWRETSGYRSRAQEDQLRREGAGTVPPGAISRHSMGTPDAPGAYDAVVYGMSLSQAASVLRGAASGFSRVLAESAHGPEGAHLHIEVGQSTISLATPGAAGAPSMADVEAARQLVCNATYERVLDGVRNPSLRGC